MTANWMVRPLLSQPAIEAGRGAKDQEHVMSQQVNAQVAVVGIDVGKSSFQIVGQEEVTKWLKPFVAAGALGNRHRNILNYVSENASCFRSDRDVF